jgi:hypothetical protein
MSNSIEFECTLLREYCDGNKKEIEVKVSIHAIAQILLKKEIPLTSNVRNPKNNKVVQSILQSFSTNLYYEIPSALILSAESAEFVDNKLSLVFGVSGGLLDGGHRLLACDIARIRNYDIKNLYLKFLVYVGHSEEDMRNMAIAVNTSTNPTQQAMNNLSGRYDWIKPHLKRYKIAYKQNDLNVPQDVHCSIGRVIDLLYLLSPQYNPYSRELVRGKSNRHPIRIFRANAKQNKEFGLKIWEEDYTHLLSDVVDLQIAICCELDMYHKLRVLPNASSPKDVRNLTHLPNGQILSIKLPKMYLYPIFSAFRAAMVKNRPFWIKDEIYFADSVFARTAIKKMISRYIELLGQKKFLGKKQETIVETESLWDEMYQIVEKLIIDL